MRRVLVLLLAFTVAASAHRSVLQSVPAPAPAPTSCPAPKSPGPTCVTEAANFQAGCGSFITGLNSATGGQVVAKTDSQIKALVAQLQAKGQTPSSACCKAALALYGDACACNSAVQALAKSQQNLSPSDFQTVGSVFLIACGVPTCYDTCRLTA